GRTARLHARPDAQRLLHHPRRGPEHEPRADADVPDAPRLRLEGRCHRRRHPDRPSPRAGVGAHPRPGHPRRDRGDRLHPVRARAAAPPRLRPRLRDGAARGAMVRMSHRRAQSILESFNFAFEGIIHVLRTQRNMRIHFLAAVVVLVAALAVGVSKLELIALLLAIAFVFITEMINSALEQAIDVATTSFDPLAKLAKDVAAGAVLIATVNAVAIGYLVFAGEVSERSTRLLDRLGDAPANVTLIALVLTILVVIATKAYTGRGTPLRGGLPSGHAALAFAGSTAAGRATWSRSRSRPPRAAVADSGCTSFASSG